MPYLATTEEQAVAAAFILLHGNPPKAVKYKGGMFSFRSPLAQDYKRRLECYAAEQLPAHCRTSGGKHSKTLAVLLRNRCLRYIMGVQ